MAKKQKTEAGKKSEVKGNKGKGASEALKDTAELKKTREAKALPVAGGKKEEVKGNKAKDQTPGAKAFYAGIDMSGKAEKTKAVALRPDVLPPETAGESLLKHPGQGAQLRDIEIFIERGLSASHKLDVASTFTAVTIGTALAAGKEIVKSGLYEKWIETAFPKLSKRMAQYYCTVSKVFMRETDRKLDLPPPKEIGDFLMRSDQETGPFAEAVKNFIGDMTLAELMDKHHIKPKKEKGGYKPGSYLVKRYQDEHTHLANKPFEVWGEKDQAEFMAWRDLECTDKSTATIEAAEHVWTTIRDTLTEQGIRRKSFAFLNKDQMSEIVQVLGLVKANVADALKGIGSK